MKVSPLAAKPADPSILIDLPKLVSAYAAASGLARGAYILADAPNGKPEVLLLATGSEVALCIQAHEQLPPALKARVSVEEASTFGWERYIGDHGESLGMHFFGASAPLKSLQQKFGFTPEHVVEAAKRRLRGE